MVGEFEHDSPGDSQAWQRVFYSVKRHRPKIAKVRMIKRHKKFKFFRIYFQYDFRKVQVEELAVIDDNDKARQIFYPCKAYENIR